MAATDVLKPDHAGARRHFIFTDEHEQLRESIRSFVLKELTPHAEEWEETTFPDWVFQRMGELGFLGLTYPESYGGQGGDYYCALVLAEEMTYSRCGGLNMGIAVHTDMATPPIHLFGTEAQKQAYLVPAIKGEKIACLGITEPDAGSDVSGIKTRAVKDGDEYVINGSKTYITNGHRSDFIVLVTKTDPDAGYDGFTLFIVDMDSPGVIREKELQKLGMHASDTALLAFQDVRVPESAVLGQLGKGFYNIMWELQGERMIGAAGCVAAAQHVFDRTLSYAKERQAFGRPISNFQVTRHKFAEMATKIETARQLNYTTAWRFANGEYPVREISMAKLYASRIAVEVADECIQIHGGAGYMKEYGIERVWRDMRLNRIGAGTDEVMLEVIGKSFGIWAPPRERVLGGDPAGLRDRGGGDRPRPRGARGERGRGTAPAGDDEPPRADRRRDRHGQDEDAAGHRRAAQESSLGLVFHYADAKGLALLDLSDLRELLTFLTSKQGKAELEGIGGLSKATAGVLLRALVGLQTVGGTEFFGEPQLDVADLMRLAPDGRGIVSCLELPAVQDRPALFSTVLMWLVAELFEQLPEAGDLPKPKLVFFLDEAHLLFSDATDAFVESVSRTVRLIRSKGVGVFFVTQAPTDLPESVLGQLGSRVQHALRAFTPKDAKDLKAVVSTYPTSDFYDVGELLTSMGIGEAAVTLLSEKGVPTPVVHTRMLAPASRMAPIADVEAAARASPLYPRYGERVDAQSARELLAGRMAESAAPDHVEAPRLPRHAPAPAGSGGIGDFLASRQGRALQRQVLRGMFGMLRKRL